jgi:hypothetical protein
VSIWLALNLKSSNHPRKTTTAGGSVTSTPLASLAGTPATPAGRKDGLRLPVPAEVSQDRRPSA